MVGRAGSPGWRRGAGLAALVLALGMAVSALLLGAAATSSPWAPLRPLPIAADQHAMVWKVVADPSSPQDLAAATSKGVWTSIDDGRTWAASPLHQFTWTLAYGSSGDVLYAGTLHAGIFRSSDSGLSWKQVNTGLRSLDVRSIATGPTAIVLGTEAGVYVSGDGLAWERAGLDDLSISAVAIVADSPLGVLAGSDQLSQPNNLYRSLDVGVASGWQAVSGGDPGGSPVFAVAAGPVLKGGTDPPILVGSLKGLYASADGGGTWQAQALAGGALWSVDAIAFDPDNPAVIYVGGDNGGSTGGGLQRTTDGGGTWVAFQHGLANPEITSLTSLSTTPLTVLATFWNPVGRVGGVARALDATAPPPVALKSSSGTPISVAVSPTPTARPTPRHHHHKAAGRGPISVPLLVAVIVVVIVLLVLFAIYRRRRRLRLEAEAPP
ncbi:MAG TPA: hypothetical protein VI138_00415 [Candidatus Dormibacteraeota bacterium]